MAYMDYEKLINDYEETQDNVENSSFATRALSRGVDQLQGMAYGGLGIIGDKIGSDTLKTVGIEGYIRNQEEAAKNPGLSMGDISGVGSGAQWVTEKLIENIPTMVSTLGIGSLFATGVKLAAKQAVAKGVTAATSAYLAGGSVYGEGIERGFDNSTSAAVIGILMGALETIGGASRIFNFSDATKEVIDVAATAGKKAAITGDLGLAKKMLNKAAGVVKSEGTKQAIGETSQEMGQEMLSLANILHNEKDFEYWSDENLKRIFEAGAGGFAVGGVTGKLTSTFSNRQKQTGDFKNLEDIKMSEQDINMQEQDAEDAIYGIREEKKQAERLRTAVPGREAMYMDAEGGYNANIDEPTTDLIVPSYQTILEQDPNENIKRTPDEDSVEAATSKRMLIEESTGDKRKLDEINEYKKQLENKYPNAPDDRLYYKAASDLGYLKEYKEYQRKTKIEDARKEQNKYVESIQQEQNERADAIRREKALNRVVPSAGAVIDYTEPKSMSDHLKEYQKESIDATRREEALNRVVPSAGPVIEYPEPVDIFQEYQNNKKEIEKTEARAKELIKIEPIKKETPVFEKKQGEKINIVGLDDSVSSPVVVRTVDDNYIHPSYGKEFKNPDVQSLFKKYVSDKNVKVTAKNVKDIVKSFKEDNKKNIETIKKREATFFLEDTDSPINIQYEVVELKDLISSSDRSGLYPKKLQPRDRDRKILNLKLERIANKFVAARAFENTTPSNGAPTVAKDSVILDDKGDIIKKNIVLSGNGLTDVLKKLYSGHPDKVKEYKKMLVNKTSGYGIPPKIIKGMEQPVFIRRIIDDIDEADFAIRANDKVGAGYTPTETASIDSKLIKNVDLEKLDGTDAGFKKFAVSILNKLPISDQAELIHSGDKINQKAIERVKAAIFKKAYGSDTLLTKKFEETNDDIKNITAGMTSASQTFAKLDESTSAKGSKAIAKSIVDAVQIVIDAKGNYKNITPLKGLTKIETQVLTETNQMQIGKSHSKEAVAIAKVMAKNARSGKSIGGFLDAIGKQYLTIAKDSAQKKLFPDDATDKLSLLDTIKNAADTVNNETKKSITKNAIIKDSLSLDEIKKAFNRMPVTKKDNGYEIHFRDGHSWTVETANEITDNSVTLSGRSKIAGKFDPAQRSITISKYGDFWTVRHEQYHAFETLGMIKKSEINIINREINGKATTEEQRAKWVEETLKERSYKRESIIGRVIQKIADFVDAIANIGTVTSRGVLRGIESGKIQTREQTYSTDNGTRFSIKDIEDSGYFESTKKKKTFNDIKDIVTSSLANKNIKDDLKIKTSEAADKFKIKYADRLHAISVYLGENSKAYKKERLFTGIRDTVDAFLKHGKMSVKDDMVVVTTKDKGFMALYNKYGEDNIRKAGYWMAVDRAAELEKHNKEKWLTKDARKFIRDAIGEPPKGQSWIKIASEIQAFNDNVLDIAEHAGIINKEGRKGWIGDFYVPFHRIFEDPETGAEFFRGQQLSRKHISAQIKKLSGAEMKLGDPITNMIKNWSHLIHESSRNMARTDTVDSLISKSIQVGENKNGAPKLLLEKVPSSNKFRYNKDTKQTYVIGDSDLNPVVSIQREGKAEYYKVNDEYLYTALAQTDIVNRNSMLWKTVTASKRVFTQSIMANPATLAANLHRDIMNAKIMRKDFTLGDVFKGAKSVWSEDENYVLMQSAQATFGSNYVDADDSRNFQKYVDKITNRKKFDGVGGIVLDKGEKIISFLKKIQNVSENAVRAGIFEKELKKEGGNVLDAAFSAKDIIDFSNRGQDKILNTLTAITPFMNSRIQGLYSGVRHYKQDRTGVLLRGGTLSAATALLWAVNKDDDKYKQLEDWDKRTYYHMFLGNYHIRVPKPFEVGAIFSTLVDSTLDAMAGDENGKYLASAMVNMAAETFNLIPSSPLPLAALEIAANKNFFTQRPIESLSLQPLKPGARAEWYTSDTAQVIGKKLNISPRKIEHLVRGQFAWLGTTALSLVDTIARDIYDMPKHPKNRLEDTIFVGRFIHESDKPARQNKYMTNFYKAWEDISQSHNTIKLYTLSGDFESAKKISTDDKEYAKWYKEFNTVKSKVSAITKQIKTISKSRSIAPNVKSTRIDTLLLERNKLYKQTMERYRKG